MNIHELQTYNLADAVKFHDNLNPRIFGSDEKLLPEVREKLLAIAADFQEFLGVSDLQIQDITLSGSNAAYSYAPHSDIDLHLVVQVPEDEVYRELFDAKKYQYNDEHDIRIGGYDVELYVQDADQPHVSQGIYSVLNDDWISVPKRRRAKIDDMSVQHKYEDIGARVEQAIESDSLEQVTATIEKVKQMRKAGLETNGEFGPENLAYKMLRSQSYIQRLFDRRNELKDRELSLNERRKKAKKKKFRYGAFGGYWYPGFGYAGQDHAAGSEGGGGDGGGESQDIREASTPDGVSPSTRMFLSETPLTKKIISRFVRYVAKRLGIEKLPVIELHSDAAWSEGNTSFGRFDPETHTLHVSLPNRHILDIMRTTAHELAHCRQHEIEPLPADAGETGSDWENEAHAVAGIIMRDFTDAYPEYFEKESVDEGIKSKLAAGALTAALAAGGAQAQDRTIGQALGGAVDAARTAQTLKRMGWTGAQEDLRQEIINYSRALGGDANAQNQSWLYRMQKRQGTLPPAPRVPPQSAEQAAADFEAYKKEYYRKKAEFDKQFQQNEELKIAVNQSQKDKDDYYRFLRAKKVANKPMTRNELEFLQNYELAQQMRRKMAENASGYIPTKKQAKDPRYSMALTQDIRPGEVGRQANKMALKTDSQGRPGLLMKTVNLRESTLEERLAQELAQFKDDPYEYIDPRNQRAPANQFGMNGHVDESAQGESETQHGWRAELVDEINPTTYEVRLTNRRSRESANFVVRPVDMIRSGVAGPLAIDSMDIQDLQTGDTRSIQSDSAAPWVYILDAVDALFYDTPALQQRLQAQLKSHEKKGLPLLPGLKQRQSAGQGIAAKDFVAGQDAIARAQGKQLDEDDLDEVKMSPTALEKFATSDAAKGIRAGFEAELIFRDTQGESDEMDPEPDYDYDERAYSIQQVIEFFSNDEYGFGLSDRGVSRLENDLDETYMNWYDERVREDFGNEAEDLVREQHLDEVPMGERILAVLTDGMELTDDQAEKIFRLGSDAPKFTTSAEQEAFAEQNPDYRTYMEAVDDADAILDEEVETSIRKQDGYYDQALDDFRDSYSPDSDSFFSDVGLRWMSDIANEYNLDWPVWNMDAQSNNGSRDWDDIGSSLQDAVDMPVKVSTNYHSAARREGTWIIEPDGSLDPDDKSEEMGLEIVSPPMPLLMAIEKLKAVVDWANDPNGGNAYTNSSTGLHMGVSLPRIKSEDANDSVGIDYVKLILFMGDKYVQQQFGRTANTYCASALDKLKQNIKGGRSDPAGVVELLRHGLTELAYRELQKGVGTSKYTSAHLQDGYVEFRSPGGDWLAKGDEEIGILENTMLRFARAMAIAGDPSAERQEYAKKLYKLVTQDNEQYADQLRLFSEFSAGTINKEQLKKQWADTVLQKELPGTGKDEYEVYRRDNKDSPDGIVGTLYAKDYDSAYDLFLRQYGRDINELDVRIKQPWFDVFDATGKMLLTMRASDIDKATQRVQYEYGERSLDWNIYRRPDETPEPKVSPRAQVAKRIVKKPATATQYNYEIVDQRTVDLRVVDRFHANSDQEASRVFDRWLKMKDLPNDTADYGYRKGQQAADDQRDSVDVQRRLGVQDVNTDVAQNFEPRRQNYELVLDDDPDRVIHFMRNATADEVRAWIAQQEQEGMPPGLLRTRIVAEAIDPVSGAGAVPPRPVIKKKSMDRVEPVEPVVRSLKSRSAIGQAIDQHDIENMTQQIQMARKLGDDVNENFADGKVKGKSRPGRVKRAGASCNGSVTSLRQRAKNASGEKAKMYHWCANMKSGRSKKK